MENHNLNQTNPQTAKQIITLSKIAAQHQSSFQPSHNHAQKENNLVAENQNLAIQQIESHQNETIHNKKATKKQAIKSQSQQNIEQQIQKIDIDSAIQQNKDHQINNIKQVKQNNNSKLILSKNQSGKNSIVDNNHKQKFETKVIQKKISHNQYHKDEIQQELFDQTKQLKSIKQRERIKQLQQNIILIENKIKKLQSNNLEEESQKIFQNIQSEIKPQEQRKATMIKTISGKKKTKKKQQQPLNFNVIKQEQVKKLIIELEQNKKGIKIIRDMEAQEQQKRKKNQKFQQNSPPFHLLDTKIQISSNIYNYSIKGEPSSPTKNLQQSSQIHKVVQKKILNENNSFNTPNKEKIQKSDSIPKRSQNNLQKQRLKEEFIILKQKLQQLQTKKNSESRVQEIPQQTNKFNDHISDVVFAKIKLKDIFWHSDKKNQDNIRMYQEETPQSKFPNSEVRNFRTSFRPSSKRKINNTTLFQQTQNQSKILKQEQQIQSKKSKQFSVPSKSNQLNSKRSFIQQNNSGTQTINKKIVLENMKFPKLPPAPLPYQTPKQLMQIGRQVLAVFGIIIDSKQVLNIKKFKNCVYFNNKNYHIVWHFEGKFYIGGWKQNNQNQGEKQGNGIEFVPTKYLYQGNFKNGRRSGYGVIKYENGDIYEGDWIEGLRDGKGKFLQVSGSMYQGQWKQGKKQGFGKLKISDHQIYEGNFKKNLKSGHGKESFKNGDSYQGEYLNGKFSGKGIYKWANGSIYQGEFKNGSRNGYGIWKANLNKICDIYQGEYVNDKKCGKGKYIWQNGSTYEGQFLNDLKHGQGTLRFIGGKVLKAMWQNGVSKKKLYCQQEQLYKQSKKLPKLQTPPSSKNTQQQQQIPKKFRITNKSIKNSDQKSGNEFYKSAERKIQLNNILRVGDL